MCSTVNCSRRAVYRLIGEERKCRSVSRNHRRVSTWSSTPGAAFKPLLYDQASISRTVRCCERNVTTSKHSESSESSRWVARAWLNSVPKNLDLSGVYRTLETLHVDLPKMIPDYKVLLESLKQSLPGKGTAVRDQQIIKTDFSYKNSQNLNYNKIQISNSEKLQISVSSSSSHTVSRAEPSEAHADVSVSGAEPTRAQAGVSVSGVMSSQLNDESVPSPLQSRIAAIRVRAGHTERNEQEFGDAMSSTYECVESFNSLSRVNDREERSGSGLGSGLRSGSGEKYSSVRRVLVETVKMLGKSESLKHSQLTDNQPVSGAQPLTDSFFESNGRKLSDEDEGLLSLNQTFLYSDGARSSGKTSVTETPTRDTTVSAAVTKEEHKVSTDETKSSTHDKGLSTGLSSLKSQALAVASTAYASTSGLVRQVKEYIPSSVDASTLGDYLTRKNNGRDSSVSATVSSSVQPDSAPRGAVLRRPVVSREAVERRTRALVLSLREARMPISQIARAEELSRHLTEHPESGGVAVKNKVIPCLLRLRARSHATDEGLNGVTRELLSLLGYSDPVKSRGIRILSLDGGGTRGLIAIELLKKLEAATRCPIHELFDYICGASTGALIAVMTGVLRVPLHDTEQLYKQFSAQMFARNRLLGAGKLFMSHAYYDSDIWEKILQENIGFKSFLETSRDGKCPKIMAVSALMNVHTAENFLFRNYGYSPTGRRSHYAGHVKHKLWQGIRASSAAPGYFEQFDLGDFVHQDGGLLTNNPTALAIHESQLLWPGSALQCVVSIGTGKYTPSLGSASAVEPVSKTSLKSKVIKIVQSATDTEAVHTTLLDLLKPSTYFRFNPHMSEEFVLDEIREEKWNQMRFDTEMYCRKNELQIQRAALRLNQSKPVHRRVAEWCKLRYDMIG